MSRIGWGVALEGHDFDLEDWEAALKPPFDPWIVRANSTFALRSSAFDVASSATEVRDRAFVLLALLNGALAAIHNARIVRFGGVLEFLSDGSNRRTVFVEGRAEGRSKARASAVVLGPDGQEKPPPLQRQSDVQLWLQIADTDAKLSDALTYFSRSDNWFDIYKALECLIFRFGGGKKAFLREDWTPVTPDEIEILWTTANNERHASYRNKPNPSPMPRERAQELLGTLIKLAFDRAQQQSASGPP